MSALPAKEREEARRLLELVPDEDLPTLARMLAGLAHAEEDPVRAALAAAPEDDEGELSEETAAALAEGRREIAEGCVFAHEEVMRELGL